VQIEFIRKFKLLNLFSAYKSDKMMKFLDRKLFPLLYCAFYFLLPFFTLKSIFHAIIYGSFWATIFCLSCYLFYTDICYHALYLFLVCLHFKLKLSEINRRIKECVSSREAFEWMKQLNSIHLEIHQSNRQFWCFYLTKSMLTFVCIISFFSYCLIFNDQLMEGFFIIIFISIILLFIILSLFILCPSCIAFEGEKSNKLFINCM
jgi:hypothetical protein